MIRYKQRKLHLHSTKAEKFIYEWYSLKSIISIVA